ncbi:MAG: hypothetical protein Q9182_002248 [Xanthomendoza sp. 2 TL-2023]
MSSVFTFDPDPPEPLSSPWPVSLAERQIGGSTCQRGSDDSEKLPSVTSLTEYGIESLDPEPQDGPTEYKLHLLLRPRRSFAVLSTVQRVSGSHSSRSRTARLDNNIPVPSLRVPPTPASSSQSRESRLQNLTTQLLWRLQQSSPHHSASRSDLILPVLPGVPGPLDAPRTPEKLIPGLEDSQGALYEIGVADDGTLVGLTEDELDESLAVLRAMAFSLGCEVQVQRRIIVGDCQWLEDDARIGKPKQNLRKEKLCVAEAWVFPAPISKGSRTTVSIEQLENHEAMKTGSTGDELESTKRTDQLRVSLTGSTTSGKSSLLGTLSTSTLDNGRGKSRLSLLRHRHEIASGVTSSVTGALIGYHDADIANDNTNDNSARFQVINYASGDVSSWTDIHGASDPGRLVYLNDSAGHPKFRRTTVRGLVSWAPHWTLCCIAADHEHDSTGRAGATASASDILGSTFAEIDLARAHLELCLKLGLPLVVVITKIELASIGALKRTLGKILSQLKSAGRRPEILSSRSNEQLQTIDRSDELEVLQLFPTISEFGAWSIVPIVLTSAVTGKGVSKLHVLLRHLPICKPCLSLGSPDESADETFRPSLLFHIDEIFAAPNLNRIPRQGNTEVIFDSILSGHLRCGSLVVGQELLLGPFSTSSSEEDPPLPEMYRANSYPRIKGSPKANNSRRILPRPLSGDFPSATRFNDESAQAAPVWRRVRICSIRNLRLPVNRLLSDQVGTISLGLPITIGATNPAPLALQDRIRKGMVLLNLPDESTFNSLQAYNGFVALLEATDALALHPGASVIAYIASIRAPTRVVGSRMLAKDATSAARAQSLVRCNPNKTGGAPDLARVTCQFLSSQEWFEMDSQVLVMPASGFDISHAGSDKGERLSVGLEGLVGRIVQGLH